MAGHAHPCSRVKCEVILELRETMSDLQMLMFYKIIDHTNWEDAGKPAD